MFEKFFKDLIIYVIGQYVEDFSETDVQVDNYNGLVLKENMVVKKTALESIMRSIVGAPVRVTTGYIRKAKATIPWNEILTKPVEIVVSDLHVVCDSPAAFDKEFAERALHKAKRKQFDELLRQFKEQCEQRERAQAEGQEPAAGEQTEAKVAETSESYITRLQKVILQNLRVVVNNIHVRFEDTGVSRREKSFNFGVLVDQVQYSSTNNRFERVFLNIDDKKRENRSFSMLEVKQAAVYWNTNVHENWTNNSEFVNLDCAKTIDFSKKYVENLKRKYHQFQQNYNQNQVYLIQPLDLTIKWRKNLNQKLQPGVPLTTDNIDISQLLITLDEEIYKDIQYLAKFWSWHSSAVKKGLTHLRFRPGFNEPIKGNCAKYWKYAIKATLYYLKKARNQASTKSKRQRQMIELSQLYRIKQFNAWIKSNFKQNIQKDHFIQKVELRDPYNIEYDIRDPADLAHRIFKIECKLSAEQMVVAYTKAEKEAHQLIEEKKETVGWTSWISSSVMSFMGYSQSDATQEDGSSLQQQKEQEDIHLIMKKLEDFERISDSSSLPNQISRDAAKSKWDKMMLDNHFALSIPVIQLSVVNKSMHQYGSKQFMMVVVQDLFVQNLTAHDNQSSLLISVKNFEIVDKLLNQQKFSRLIQKKEQIQGPERQSWASRTTRQGGASAQMNLRQQYQKQKAYLEDLESLSEIEEEMNPNINNGMQQIQDYNRIKSSLEMSQQYFLVFQLTNQNIKRADPATGQPVLLKCYNVDMMVTNLQVFYNRVLLSRTESFFNQARINKVQNAQAEAEFDDKIEKYKMETQRHVTNILEKSEVNLNCNLKSVECLVPDNVNYEVSKFLILQTGDIHLRSGESKRLNLYFSQSSQIDKQINYVFRKKIEEQQIASESVDPACLDDSLEAEAKGAGSPDQDYIDEQAVEKSGGQIDKYSFMIYDLKVLYIPTVDQLENYMYNDTNQGDADQKLSILRKMDIIVEYHTCQSASLPAQTRASYNHIKAGIGSVDVKLTNKEIQQLKDFADNIIKYHDQISFEIQRELKQIYRFNFGIQASDSRAPTDEPSSADSSGRQPLQGPEDLSSASARGQSQTTMASVIGQLGKLRAPALKRKSSQMTAGASRLDESFHSLGDGDEELLEEEKDEEEAFFDAQDYFDPDLIDQVGRLANQQLVDISEKDEDDEYMQKMEAKSRPHKSKQKMIVSICMPKLKVSVLEAQDIEKQLLRDLNEKMGSNYGRRDHQIDLDVKFKGLPFLEFDVVQANLRLFQNSAMNVLGFFVQDIALVNVEKRQDTKMILYSASNDLFQTFQTYNNSTNFRDHKQSFDETDPDLSGLGLLRTPRKASKKWVTMGPEDEDMIETQEVDDYSQNLRFDSVDLFLEFTSISTTDTKRTQIKLGETNLNVNDSLLRKFYEAILKDMPEANVSKYRGIKPKKEAAPALSASHTEFKWSGLSIAISDKKDKIILKVLGLKLEKASSPPNQSESLHVKLRDFQIIQDDCELLMRHHNSSMKTHHSGQAMKVGSFGNLNDGRGSDSENSNFQTDIVSFTRSVDRRELIQNREVVVSDFLFVMDFRRLLTIISIAKSFDALVKNFPSKSSSAHQKPAPEKQVFASDEIEVSIQESYFQLPAREGKTSLFLVIEDFYAKYSRDQEEKSLVLDDKLIQMFVAHQFDQQHRYNLISILRTQMRGLNGSQSLQSQEIKVTLNENYILLLSKLLDENFADVRSLVPDSKEEEKPKQRSEDAPENKKAVQQFGFQKLFEGEMEKIVDVLALCDFDLKRSAGVSSAALQNLEVGSIKLEWVFNQNFDEHQDKFVTFSNRKYTKMILDQLNQESNRRVDELSEIGRRDSHDEAEQQIDSSSTPLFRQGSSSQPLAPSLSQARATKKRSAADRSEEAAAKHEMIEMQLSAFVFQHFSTKGKEGPQSSQLVRVGAFHVDHCQNGSFSIAQIQEGSANSAIEVLLGKDTVVRIAYLDLKICQLNAQVVSSLTKSIYSCRNALYKGTFVQLANILSRQSKVKKERRIETLQRMEVANLRIIVFDSTNMEREHAKQNSKSSLGNFLGQAKSAVKRSFGDLDRRFNSIGNLMVDDVVDEMEEREEAADQGTSLLTPESSPRGHKREIPFRRSPTGPHQPSADARAGLPASAGEEELQEQTEVEQRIKEQFSQKLMSHDSIPARSSVLLNVSISAVITKNPKWIKYQYDRAVYDKGLNQIQMLKLKNLEVFQNNFTTTLSELTELRAASRLQKQTILHPTSVLLRNAQFLQETSFPSKQQTDVDVSTTEVEISLKQIFKLRLLAERIADKLKPITLILDHLEKQNSKISKKQPREEEARSRVKHSRLTVRLSVLYATLIKEIGDSSILGLSDAAGDGYLTSQCAPLITAEFKDVRFTKSSQLEPMPDGSVEKINLQVPMEIYYFNQSLNFFEPLVEKTLIGFSKDNFATTRTKQTRMEVKDMLNLNFSVALYDQLFNFMSILDSEQQEYEQARQSQENASQTRSKRRAQTQNPVSSQAEALYQASSYFIRNSTGEILLFKTINQRAFQEIQPDEEYPLDFQSLQNFDKMLKTQREEARATPESQRPGDLQRGRTRDGESLKEILLFERGDGPPGLRASYDGSSNDEDEETDSQHLSSAGSSDDEPESEQEDRASAGSESLIVHADDELGQSRRPLGNRTAGGVKEYNLHEVASRSIYRRRNYKFMKSEPKKVQFQVLIQYGAEVERTSVFELNVESLACQKFFLDDQKEFYVICQTQQADGKKHLIVRSPMQIYNNLQIPMEIILQNRMLAGLDREPKVEESLENMNEEDGDGLVRHDYSLHGQPVQYEMLVKPESSIVIPLRACGFNQVQMRPIHNLKNQKQSASALNRGDKKFEWTSKAQISLLKEESEIFQQEPVLLESKMLRKNTNVERNNNRIFMVLNSNIYSIRSYVDFNTQQTEFISMRYLSVSPPFILQNLVPAPITLFFKNILRKTNTKSINKGSRQDREFKDPQLYDLDLKHNSQQQILFLNPFGNFDLSLVIPGYEETSFVSFKDQKDEDFGICENIKQQHYLRALFSEEENLNSDAKAAADQKLEDQGRPPKSSSSKFRFIKEKKMLFQLVSQFQNQFNICANIAFIQGQYQVTFYSKYWLLNNTLMPLEVQISTKNYTFEQMSLPYENQDFDFETIKKFEGRATADEGHEQTGEGKTGRKGSTDSLPTQPGADGHTEKKGFGAPSLGTAKHHNDDLVDYKQLVNSQRTQMSERTQFGRIKPWEGYKFQQNENLGLLGILSQQEIDAVQVVYFTQEEFKEEGKSETTAQEKEPSLQRETNDKISVGNSQKEQRLQEALRRSSRNLAGVDTQSMMSKTSIQMLQYQELLDSQQAVPLVHTELSSTELYDAPLQDKQQLKRVILFSDSPQDESEQFLIHRQQGKENIERIGQDDKKEFLKNVSKNIQDDIKSISMKICDSDWTELPFDVTKLQGESILLKDRSRKYCTNSMYEIVANVHYLPNPFSFSKIIEFKPRYMIINKTHKTLQIIQADCEEQGLFKAYPFETSNFHWTDGNKPQAINVKFDDHEYSGNIRIDGIGEINLRLRGSYDNDSIILNVSITQERNSLYIIFNDVSYAPPYRIENLTKTSFKISQVNCRMNDFDILRPYEIIPYAWSYPLNEKLLRISISSSSNDEELGRYTIDQIKKSEKQILQDKKGRKFLLEILNEKALKIVRISYTDEFTKNNLMSNLHDNPKVASQLTTRTQLIFKHLGISVVNSQSRELAYTFIKDLQVTSEENMNDKKFEVRASDFQIDNQLVRKRDEIILKRDSELASQESIIKNDFVVIQVQYIRNDAIQNLHFFKYFSLMIIPFSLNLDGNFCDEMFRYGQDILQQTRKYNVKNRNDRLDYYLKDGINDIDKIKLALTDLKKPYDHTGREIQQQKKIYFEEFYVHEIKMRFTFNSSPIMFRELTMNPTLKFLIVLMSNLKKVQLKFGSFRIQQQQQLVSIFFAQLKRHYLQQCYNHKQILKLISSMGLFGNFSESLNNLTNAIESLVYHPFHEDNAIKGLAIGGAIFMKQTISAVVGPIHSVLQSLRSGFTFLLQYSLSGARGNAIEDEYQLSLHERNMLDDDIEQMSRDINNFETPLNAIDTQNRIWLKIITKEKMVQDQKRKYLMQQSRQQSTVSQSHSITINAIEAIDEPEEEFTTEDQEEHQLTSFYRRQHTLSGPNIRQNAYKALSKIGSLPKNLIASSASVIDNMNTRLIEEQQRLHVQKIRPPRYTSFTMQLETYSYKKAYALEILNEINLNVFQSESIQKLFNIGKYVIIFTAKRLICVEEMAQEQSKQPWSQKVKKRVLKRTRRIKSIQNDQDQEDEEDNHSQFAHDFRDTPSLRIGNSYYKHWNIDFDDIMKIKLEGLRLGTEEATLEKVPRDYLMKVSDYEQSVANQHVILNLKILYSDYDNEMNLFNKNPQHDSVKEQMAKIRQDDLLMSDFRMSSKNIQVQFKHAKKLSKIYKLIHDKSKQNFM